MDKAEIEIAYINVERFCNAIEEKWQELGCSGVWLVRGVFQSNQHPTGLEAVVDNYSDMLLAYCRGGADNEFIKRCAELPTEGLRNWLGKWKIQQLKECARCLNNLLQIQKMWQDVQAASTKNTPTTFKIDVQLQTPEAKKLLALLEQQKVKVKGKGFIPVIDTTQTPWGFASRAALRYVAEVVGKNLNIQNNWRVIERAFGVKSLQGSPEKRFYEIENVIERAGYKT